MSVRAEDPTVGEAMVRHPKTAAADVTVGQARAALHDDHVHMVLVVDGTRLLGTLVRDDLRDVDDALPALPRAVLAGRTVRADDPAAAALDALVAAGERRRAVVDDDGTLLGLLCLKRRLTGFCSDEDVSDRAAASR